MRLGRSGCSFFVLQKSVFAVMSATPPLRQFFPIRFPNGETVRRLAKPCVNCGNLVEVEHMEGAVQVLPDRALLAARARCPACGTRFPVTCLITRDKQVVRLHVPNWLVLWYLKKHATPAQQEEVAPEPVLRGIRVRRDEVTPGVEVAGRYRDADIPSELSWRQRRFVFERIALGSDEALEEDELLLGGELVYRAA